jgi:WD40 repeat protein
MTLHSSDGQTIATASDDMTVKLWDSNSRQAVATFKGHLGAQRWPSHRMTRRSFPAAADGVIKQWRRVEKTNADVLVGHNDGRAR